MSASLIDRSHDSESGCWLAGLSGRIIELGTFGWKRGWKWTM